MLPSSQFILFFLISNQIFISGQVTPPQNFNINSRLRLRFSCPVYSGALNMPYRRRYRRRRYRRRGGAGMKGSCTMIATTRRGKQGSLYKTFAGKAPFPSNGITVQHDRALQYRKRPKRRPSRFYRKVARISKSIVFKQIGVKTRVFSSRIDFLSPDTVAVPFGNVVGVIHGMGTEGDTSTILTDGRNDLRVIAEAELLDAGAAGGFTGAGIQTSGLSMMFSSCVLDWTAINVSSGTVELDVYYVKMVRNVEQTTIINIYIAAANQTRSVGLAGTGVGLEQRGCTPFDLPWASRFVQVISKTKYFLAPNQPITMQKKVKRNFKYRLPVQAQTTLGEIGPPTFGFLFIAKALPNVEWAGSGQPVIRVGFSRSYRYKVLPNQEDRDRYIRTG